MARRGVIAAYTLNNPKVIRFEPPLIVSEAQIDTAIAAFREAVAEALELLEGIEE
jgi:putrescine aminotransferase